MYTESKGRTIWRVIYPILILFGLDSFLEYADMFRYYICAFIPYADNLQSIMADTDEFLNLCLQIYSEWMSNDAMIIIAVRCLILIPLFIVFMNNDNRRAAKRNLVVSVPIWGKEKLNAKMILMGIVLGIAAGVSFNILVDFTQIARIDTIYQNASGVIYSQSLPVTILIAGIIGPVCEELLFRGLVYRRLRSCFGFIPCLVASSLMFGLFHLNITQFIFASLVGACLAYAYEKSGNILIPILVHCTINTGASILSELEGRIGYGLPLWADIILMFVGFGLIYLFYRMYPTKKEELVSPSKLYPPYRKPVPVNNTEIQIQGPVSTTLEEQMEVQPTTSPENKTEQKNWF